MDVISPNSQEPPRSHVSCFLGLDLGSSDQLPLLPPLTSYEPTNDRYDDAAACANGVHYIRKLSNGCVDALAQQSETKRTLSDCHVKAMKNQFHGTINTSVL
ncbi:hypothetical protein M514_02265 [Trichuris suis]|uniref:Uncharacterized protein n=1 Tax=Trichuris suis TaxID=68888 RepID=A0A085NKW2_9BILA|nr:hypothetical protein M514_02265 [Trichuris suis]